MTLEGIRPLKNKLMLRAEEQVNWRTNRKWGRSLENHLFPSAANNQRPVEVCRGDGTASVFLIKPPTIVLLITDLQKAGYLALCLQLPDKKQEHCCIIDIIGWLERNAFGPVCRHQLWRGAGAPLWHHQGRIDRICPFAPFWEVSEDVKGGHTVWLEGTGVVCLCITWDL